jgi:hypothetical protein
VLQSRGGRAQAGIAAAMKPEGDNRLEAAGALDQPTQRSPEKLKPPEIVGQVDNPVLEAVRRLWWRAFDRLCGRLVLIRLSILDRIYGPELPTPADKIRDAGHERLVGAFPVVGEAIEPTRYDAGQNRDGYLGSP